MKTVSLALFFYYSYVALGFWAAFEVPLADNLDRPFLFFVMLFWLLFPTMLRRSLKE